MSDTARSRGNEPQRLRLPLLDRLLDTETELSRDAAVEVLRAAVRRDMEALLNARRRRLPLPPGLTELVVSPLGYGVPDPPPAASRPRTAGRRWHGRWSWRCAASSRG